MSKTAWILCAVVAILGCQPTTKPTPNKPSSTTGTKSATKVELPDADPATQPDPEESPMTKTDPAEEPVKSPDEQQITEPKPEPEPSAEDEKLTALKDVPVDDLVAKLTDEQKRPLATRALASRGIEAVAPLVKALEHEDAQVRAAAAFTLGQLGKAAAEAKERLKTMSESDDSEVAKDAAAFALDALEEK